MADGFLADIVPFCQKGRGIDFLSFEELVHPILGALADELFQNFLGGHKISLSLFLQGLDELDMFFSLHHLKDNSFDEVRLVQKLVVVGKIGPLVGNAVLSFPDGCKVNFNVEIILDLNKILLGK